MKRFFLSITIGLSVIFTVSAQSNLNNFLGSWKLTEIKGMKKSNTPIMTLNVSHVGNELQIERLTKDIRSDDFFRDFASYNDNGASAYKSNRRGAISRGEINYLKSNKISFDTTSEGRTVNGQIVIHSTTSKKEVWTLSQDGRFLLVEIRTESRNFNDDDFTLRPLYGTASSNETMVFEKN